MVVRLIQNDFILDLNLRVSLDCNTVCNLNSYVFEKTEIIRHVNFLFVFKSTDLVTPQQKQLHGELNNNRTRPVCESLELCYVESTRYSSLEWDCNFALPKQNEPWWFGVRQTSWAWQCRNCASSQLENIVANRLRHNRKTGHVYPLTDGTAIQLTHSNATCQLWVLSSFGASNETESSRLGQFNEADHVGNKSRRGARMMDQHRRTHVGYRPTASLYAALPSAIYKFPILTLDSHRIPLIDMLSFKGLAINFTALPLSLPGSVRAEDILRWAHKHGRVS